MKMPAIHLRLPHTDRYLWISVLAEFIGTFLFQLLGGSFDDNPTQTALVFIAILYATRYVSGGHINPAVSFTALLSGHIHWLRGVYYIVAQFAGAIAGAMLQSLWDPDSAWGQVSPGCHRPIKDLSWWCVWGWETVLSSLFILVNFTAIFVRPGHGDASPLAVGAALFAALATGGQFTGNSPLNPARSFASSLIFHCYWTSTLTYILSHLTAALLVAGYSFLAFGKGVFFQEHGGPLRDSLLPGGGMEPAGDRDLSGGRFAPTGHYYAGSTPYDPSEQRGQGRSNDNRAFTQTTTA